MTTRPLLTVLAISVTPTIWSSLQSADEQHDAARKAFVAASDRAGLYIYRNEHMGGAFTMGVPIGGDGVALTGAMTYLHRDLTPGPHNVTPHAENNDCMGFEVRPGTLTCIWQQVKTDLLRARSKLHLVAEEKGRKRVREARFGRRQ
jgi:hypothetical protein